MEKETLLNSFTSKVTKELKKVEEGATAAVGESEKSSAAEREKERRMSAAAAKSAAIVMKAADITVKDFKKYAGETSKLIDQFRKNHKKGNWYIANGSKQQSRKDIVIANKDMAECFRLVPAIYFTENFDLAVL